ncbi:MAG: SEC-C metal-binding domain-containing protein [Fimbriimonadales bacterium]|jgi:preprotein translocase subunit SecA|nr:SEC-C metal-binding domain-containing protein [Fimbriimonadales bacterium]GBC89298.1 Protein translocase subunit SecA [bacterium HR14]GIV14294.1 MAG: protein translocase subunit SecA [Fimbriimonadales bacterium]CUU10166.1 preprotein translocase subunit SecA [Armatimonadetes bacterium GBS]CUU37107.1 preprotein translocase subunit SecA [Armatimonadetes bacterium GXS]
MIVREWLKKLLDPTEREVKRLWPVVHKINALEPEIQKLTNEQLRAKTDEFKKRLQDGATLDDILPEAFAVVREAARRTLNMRHFDVQLLGGIVLHQGRIAEMKTGEGKTLVATLPLYLNALLGKGVHLVTVNDYLARRDAVWMGPIYHLLGLSVGVVQGQSAEHDERGGSYIYEPGYVHPDPRYLHLREVSRKEAYAADITYGTNHEFAFDYLRDNMVFSVDDLVQRELYYAIIDEVDSILIDEARTPHIISGQIQEDLSIYQRVDSYVRRLQPGRDYVVDEKHHSVTLTEEGIERLEQMMGVRNLAEEVELMPYINAALKAHGYFKKDVHYVVRNGEIIIVDEFTGRLMHGRRFSDGIHQALEAKEGVPIKQESQTIAVVTFQNYFRLYQKLAGMTGTAKTEEEEFRKIYGMDVVCIPTHRPMIRIDHPDVVYKTLEAKLRGIALEILRLYTKQQPVLVGTRSIEMSEVVSSRLTFDKLQMLVLIERARRALEEAKDIDKKQREDWRKTLLMPLNALSMRQITPILRALNLPTSPTDPAHVKWFLEHWELPEENAQYFIEAMEHGIPHNVLNAKYHEKEARIIAEAGRKGAVTIATNMAGRGVDILLGGSIVKSDENESEQTEAEAQAQEAELLSFRRGGKERAAPPLPLSEQERSKAAEEVRKLGGLYVLGTERHESRRIDNQLRGRAGRQGDPGESRFFLSLDDELIRLFGENLRNSPLLKGWPEDEPLEAKMLSRAIENAQKRVELHNFSMRKYVLQYDDVLNNQRQLIYRMRREILFGIDTREKALKFIREMLEEVINEYAPRNLPPTEWDMQGLYQRLNTIFPLEFYIKPDDFHFNRHDVMVEQILEWAEQAYQWREEQLTPEIMRELERYFMLQIITRRWVEHLASMDYLREGIGLRGYGQIDPLVAYKQEAAKVFAETLAGIRNDVVMALFHAQVVPQQPQTVVRIHDGSPNPATAAPAARPAVQRLNDDGEPVPQPAGKVGRNDPCPCGSGKKYKKCCYPKYG